MSLDGNLRVFSLTEVFQMLGMQQKSGILTVEGPKDTISVGFLSGRIVSVESGSNPIENRLGTLLVKAGKLSEAALAGALEIQKRRQDRLGRLMLAEGIVRPEDLREAARLQFYRIIFGAFGWADGHFRFDPRDSIEYDGETFPPMETESVLLEAARTFDELPRAEKKIPSNELVFRRAAAYRALALVSGGPAEKDGTLSVSRREAEAWKWIDGRRTVGEIRERAFLSELDVLRGISDLLDRGLIEKGQLRETPVLPSATPGRRVSLVAAGLWIPVLAALAVGIYFAPRNRANQLLVRPIAENRPTRELLKANSFSRLLAIGRGVRVFYATTGRHPRTLGQLSAEEVLDDASLRDPFGRFYRYILRPEDGKFAIFGRNAKGQIDLDLSHEGQLAPTADSKPPGARIPAPDEPPPAVKIVR